MRMSPLRMHHRSLLACFGWVSAILVATGCGADSRHAAENSPATSLAGAGGGGSGGGDSAAGEGGGTGGNTGTPSTGTGATAIYNGPEHLSETGLYSDLATKTVRPDIIAYDVAHPLWSDGTEKRRYLSIPEGGVIDNSDADRWIFPIGTQSWKEFWKDGTLVETRFLEKRSEEDGGWSAVAFVWDSSGTEAEAAPFGVPDALGTTHDVPGEELCVQCHSGSKDFLIGVATIQLSGEEGLLTQLAEEGLLSTPLTEPYVVPGEGVVQEALGYLHGNCGHCHGDDYFLADKRFLRFRLRVADKSPEETPAYTTTFGIKAAHVIDDTDTVIVPGEPDKSQTYVRMTLRNLSAMPPVGTEETDPDGLRIVREWIAGLE